jgi:hypothetical protein
VAKRCENCIYLSDEGHVVAPRLYNSIYFRGVSSYKLITYSTPICAARLEKTGINRLDLIVDDPQFLNRNNDCLFYREKVHIRIINWIKSLRKQPVKEQLKKLSRENKKLKFLKED